MNLRNMADVKSADFFEPEADFLNLVCPPKHNVIQSTSFHDSDLSHLCQHFCNWEINTLQSELEISYTNINMFALFINMLDILEVGMWKTGLHCTHVFLLLSIFSSSKKKAFDCKIF